MKFRIGKQDHSGGGAVAGYSLEQFVAMVCTGATALVAVFAVLSFISLLSSRGGDATAERAAAAIVGLVALAVSVAVAWSASAAPPVLNRLIETVGVPAGLIQIPAAFGVLAVAVLAWRFPKR